ncbi:MAG: glycosyltransferase, partial [Methanobrevibacter sp.]|nr:glycosyltransferase [Candidatus Methanoflexus mossambicus]
MDLSIIIVNYGTYELTKGAIESIIANNNLADNSYSFNPDSGVDSDSGADFGFDYEIILVDNDSPDDSYEKLINYFSDSIEKDLIKPIANKSNQGFAAANNIGIKIAKGDFILLLNSDTEVKENTLEECLNYIKDHEDIGAVGCKVLLPDGTLDKACKRSFPNPKNSFYKLFGFSNNKNNNYNLDCL